MLAAAEVTPADVKAAEESKSQQVAAAKAAIDDLEVKRAEAAKKQRYQELKRLNLELKKAREQLQSATDSSVEALAVQFANEREAAELARADAERAAEAVAASRLEEQERLRVSGGCPLVIKGGNFAHVRGVGEVAGRRTLVRCDVTNPTNSAVEAHELLVQFLDGFDKVIDEHRLQGTRIKPGQTTSSLSRFPVAETAVVTKIFIERAKLADGTVWERKPEFKNTGMILKKPEGAWID
jgi:multidrug efflux pump subunit AcrA (membrane-fusion protein)